VASQFARSAASSSDPRHPRKSAAEFFFAAPQPHRHAIPG